MIRPQQHGLAVLVSSWKENYGGEGNYGGVSLCCFKFLSLEFGENLGLLYSVVHKLFGNLTFYRNLLKKAFKTVAQYYLYCNTVLFTCFEHVRSFRCV